MNKISLFAVLFSTGLYLCAQAQAPMPRPSGNLPDGTSHKPIDTIPKSVGPKAKK